MPKLSEYFWKNRKPFGFLIRYYFRNLKPGVREIMAIREKADAAFACAEKTHADGAVLPPDGNVPDTLAAALYAEEKEKIGALYYNLCKDACEYAGIEIEIRGAENLPDAGTAVCFVANHQGYADVVALGYALGGLQISFIAKDALAKLPLFGSFIPDIRGIYIPTRESKRAHVAVINRGVEYLEKGFNMAIFPEGTRSWGPQFYEGGFMKGSLQLAFRAEVPIVPVALEGSYHIFEDNKVISPGKIIVKFLPPVPTKGLPRQDRSVFSDRIFETIKGEVRGIQRELGISLSDEKQAPEKA